MNNVICVNSVAGGLVGAIYDVCNVSNCYATGYISGGNYLGGLVGNQYGGGGGSNCFFDTQTTGRSSAQGVGYPINAPGVTGKTTAEMHQQSVFTDADWDFTGVWGIYENYGYPYLKSFGNDILIIPVGGSKTYDESPAPMPIDYTVDGYSVGVGICVADRRVVLAAGYYLTYAKPDARKYPRPLYKGARVHLFIVKIAEILF